MRKRPCPEPDTSATVFSSRHAPAANGHIFPSRACRALTNGAAELMVIERLAAARAVRKTVQRIGTGRRGTGAMSLTRRRSSRPWPGRLCLLFRLTTVAEHHLNGPFVGTACNSQWQGAAAGRLEGVK